MDWRHQSDSQLEQRLKSMLISERQSLADMLMIMDEIYTRKLHLERGYSGLAEYCNEFLGMSESQAYKRCQAVKVVRRFPKLLEDLRQGRTHLSHLVTVAPHLDELPADKLPEWLTQASKRQLEALIAGQCHDLKDANPKIPITFYLTQQQREMWQRLRIQMTESSESSAFVQLIQRYLHESQPPQPRAPGAKKTPRSDAAPTLRPYLAKHLRYQVFIRGEGRCEFRGTTGKRCTSTDHLEVDHIVPVAQGGTHDLSNLRLLCRQHNQLHADHCFGRQHMDSKRSE